MHYRGHTNPEGIVSQSLAERVRSRRIERGLTHRQLAEKAGVSAQHIDRLEMGYIKTPHTITKIAAALEVDPIWLAGGVESLHFTLNDGKPAIIGNHPAQNIWPQMAEAAPYEPPEARAWLNAAGMSTACADGCSDSPDPWRVRRLLFLAVGIAIGFALGAVAV